MSPQSWALYWRTWQSQRRKKNRQLNARPSSCLEGGGKWGARTKAQGLKCHGRGSRPCNRESAGGGWQTDRQTDFPPIIVRLHHNYHSVKISAFYCKCDRKMSVSRWDKQYALLHHFKGPANAATLWHSTASFIADSKLHYTNVYEYG